MKGGEGIYRVNSKRVPRRQIADALSSSGLTLSNLNIVTTILSHISQCITCVVIVLGCDSHVHIIQSLHFNSPSYHRQNTKKNPGFHR